MAACSPLPAKAAFGATAWAARDRSARADADAVPAALDGANQRSAGPVCGLGRDPGHADLSPGVPAADAEAKRQVWEDLQKVLEALGRPGSPSAAGPPVPDGEVSPASPQP